MILFCFLLTCDKIDKLKYPVVFVHLFLDIAFNSVIFLNR